MATINAIIEDVLANEGGYSIASNASSIACPLERRP